MVDLKKIIFIFIYILVCMCVGAHGVYKRAPGPLELQSQAVVSHPLWRLGTKLSFPGRAESALSH